MMKNEKMSTVLAIVAFLVLFQSHYVMAKSEVIDFYPVEWKEQITKFQLPKPFNEVEIKINKSGKKLDGIDLVIGRDQILFDDSLLEGIENISHPDISYGRLDFDKDKEIDSFKIYFESVVSH